MQRSDRLSEDVIKIFHNAKGSVIKNISKWTKNASVELDNEHELQHLKWDNHDSHFDHAAGEYEPLPTEHTHPKKADDSNHPVPDNTPKSALGIPPANTPTTQAEIDKTLTQNKDNSPD